MLHAIQLDHGGLRCSGWFMPNWIRTEMFTILQVFYYHHGSIRVVGSHHTRLRRQRLSYIRKTLPDSIPSVYPWFKTRFNLRARV